MYESESHIQTSVEGVSSCFLLVLSTLREVICRVINSVVLSCWVREVICRVREVICRVREVICRVREVICGHVHSSLRILVNISGPIKRHGVVDFVTLWNYLNSWWLG